MISVEIVWPSDITEAQKKDIKDLMSKYGIRKYGEYVNFSRQANHVLSLAGALQARSPVVVLHTEHYMDVRAFEGEWGGSIVDIAQCMSGERPLKPS